MSETAAPLKDFVALASLFFSFVSVVVGGLISYVSRVKEKERDRIDAEMDGKVGRLEVRCAASEARLHEAELKQRSIEGDLRVEQAQARAMQTSIDNVEEQLVTRKEFDVRMDAMETSIVQVNGGLTNLNGAMHDIKNMLIEVLRQENPTMNKPVGRQR